MDVVMIKMKVIGEIYDCTKKNKGQIYRLVLKFLVGNRWENTEKNWETRGLIRF